MRDEVKQVRAWRAEGMTLAAIQDQCRERNIKTQLDTTPSTKTIHIWCQGVDIPKPPREPRRARSPITRRPPPRQRLDQRPENLNLIVDIFRLRDAGYSLRQVTEELYTLGYRTSKGTRIGLTQIHRIVSTYARAVSDRPTRDHHA